MGSCSILNTFPINQKIYGGCTKGYCHSDAMPQIKISVRKQQPNNSEILLITYGPRQNTVSGALKHRNIDQCTGGTRTSPSLARNVTTIEGCIRVVIDETHITKMEICGNECKMDVHTYLGIWWISSFIEYLPKLQLLKWFIKEVIHHLFPTHADVKLGCETLKNDQSKAYDIQPARENRYCVI